MTPRDTSLPSSEEGPALLSLLRMPLVLARPFPLLLTLQGLTELPFPNSPGGGGWWGAHRYCREIF